MSSEWIKWNGGECPVPKGTLVDVRFRGGKHGVDLNHVETGIPAGEHASFETKCSAISWRHNEMPGDIIAYRLHQPEKPPVTIEQLLSKANHHAAKAAKHERKRDELIQQARELLPEGWELKECELVRQPEDDMTNPENWKAGDVVECVKDGLECFTNGREYRLTEWSSGEAFKAYARMISVFNDIGIDHYGSVECFRWLRRPSSQD